MAISNFKKKNEQESVEFQRLMKVFEKENPSATKGRRLLSLVDHIIDYYLLREDDDLKMPIIYFPTCEDWAQSLCEEFVAMKMALTFGNTVKSRNIQYCKLNPYVVLPSDVKGKDVKNYDKRYVFRKKVERYISDDFVCYPAKKNEKCWIFSRYLSNQLSRTANFKKKYWLLQEFLGSETSLFNTKYSLSLLPDDEDSIYNNIEENDGEIKIPNVFLFLQKDMDGRHNSTCLRLQRTTINEYNEDYNTGIKNVFFFVFSKKPYRLHRIFETKFSLSERLQREKASQTRDFISFTAEEMDYLFNRVRDSFSQLIIDYPKDSEQHEIKLAADFVLENLQHQAQLRNEMALCLTDSTHEAFKNEVLELDPEAPIVYLDYFNDVMRQSFTNIEDELWDFVAFQCVHVIVDYNVGEKYKRSFADYLINTFNAVRVTFGDFKEFKCRKNYDNFENSIIEDRILILSYLNHSTGKNWAIFPNSFDEIYLTGNQKALEIINRFAFDPLYGWSLYRYLEQSRLILNSSFRKLYMKNALSIPIKPSYLGNEPKDDEDEQEARNRQKSYSENRYTITFDDNQHRTLNESDLLLCQNVDELEIFSVGDLLRIFDDPSGLEVQPLEDLFQSLSFLATHSNSSSGPGESVIRYDSRYVLTAEERNSSQEMWKILLQHKANEIGEQNLFNEIMSPLLPMERIQFNSFRRWLDPNDSSIMPRNRKMQKRVIEEYLGVDPLYTRILRHRKSLVSTSTEDSNNIMRSFLEKCLLTNNYQNAFKSLSNEVCDYLDLTNAEDVKSAIELVSMDIYLRTIKSVK